MDMSIALGFLMNEEEKLEVLNALAHKDFFSQEWLLAHLRIVTEVDSPHFGSSDLDFARKIAKMGLPLENAVRISYLTSLESAPEFDAKREWILKKFIESKHDIKLENSGESKGLTTLELYIIVALVSDTFVADRILAFSLSEPGRMRNSINSLSEIISSPIFSEITDEGKLNALLAVISPSFPKRSNGAFADTLSGILELLKNFNNWNLAGKLRREQTKITKDILDYVGVWLGGVNRSNWSNEEGSYDPELLNLVSVIEAVYSPEVITNSRKVFSANQKYFVGPSGSYSIYYTLPSFLIFVTILNYLQSGGSTEDPIDWVLATQPLLRHEEIFAQA